MAESKISKEIVKLGKQTDKLVQESLKLAKAVKEFKDKYEQKHESA